MKLEAYALIGDLHTAALVGANGSIDWLCLPRFDSEACLAALIGGEEHGCWVVAPAGEVRRSSQSYRKDTLVLETRFETADGAVRVIDFMPPDGERHDLFRIVEGERGCVPMRMRLALRFDYGRTHPWLHPMRGGLRAVAGPNAVLVRSDVELACDHQAITAEFRASAGERHVFALCWYPAHEAAPEERNVDRALAETEKFWRDWCGQCSYDGPWREAVLRSSITVKALTYRPTGGIVAAATTSLPERPGGVRNWDYRYCWLRDATFTLRALMHAGFNDEATAWGDWLLRAVAGDPGELQMLYGPAGERYLSECELSHFPGYEGAKPVRIGNAASNQFQLDVYGEIMDATQLKRRLGLPTSEDAWHLQRRLVDFVVENWRKPDEGIWEVRGPPRHFTHSKVMAWVALDRGIEAVESHGLEGDVERWRAARREMHETICAQGYNAQCGVFTQYFGADRLDASLLMIPLVGFLPIEDERVQRTVLAIRDQLRVDGFVHRYHAERSADVDGLPPGEGAFLPCSFWLVDCLGRMGRVEEARDLFERLLAVRTPTGLLSEEYDAKARRLAGNFPQAFSHVALINSARDLTKVLRPRERTRENGNAVGEVEQSPHGGG